MWWLAIKAMLADRAKLLTSLLGVTFAVILVNLQGGLYLGLMQKASMLVECGDADVWVGHRHMSNVDIGTYIPERWVHRVRAVEGVERADPYIVMFTQANMPDGRFEVVMIVGSDSASLLGNAWNMAEGRAEAIRQPDAVLIDISDAEKLGNCKVGDLREINGQKARVVGITRGIVGFSTNPYVFTTMERARSKYIPGVPPGQCSYFLVKAKPGTDIQALKARIRERCPELDVYDRKQYADMCVTYWLTRTGIGISFGLAAFLGLLVGLAVVAQTLYASVNERIKEFGTLKAMGADDRCVSRFLLAQALGNAILGAVLGLGVAVLLGKVITTPRAPVMITQAVAGGSVVLVTVVCLVAAGLPYLRIRRIDPASVLRS
jgi:putative ABC transport system permease protein